MSIELLFIAVALVVVPLTGGSYKKLFTTKFKSKWTLIFVLLGFAFVEFVPLAKSRFDDVGIAILLASYILLIGFILANISKKSMWLSLVGICSNAIVIALNVGMPVKSTAKFMIIESIKHQASTSKDLLKPLSDIFILERFKIAISVGDIIFGFGLILIAIALSRKDKKPVIVYAQDFEIEEIVDDNFAEREELIPQIESHQPVLFRIESELMPATNMDNDIEFIEQVQVLQSQLSKVGNAKEANDPDYIIVSPPEVNISIPNLEQADEIIDLNIDKELVDVQNKRKYRGSSHRRSSRKRLVLWLCQPKKSLAIVTNRWK